MKAKVSEIFLSYQGEGPFTGSRQLFIRFYGCNMSCGYCDTFLSSYKSFSKENLLGKILDFGDDYNELSLTGGEPLLYADFLKEFLPLFKKHCSKAVYLETNGTLPKELCSIIEYVDIIAMDFKLPSSTNASINLWREHREFVKIAAERELIIKAVITDSTTIDDIKTMSGIIKDIAKDCAVILQPVTPVNDLIKGPDEEMLSYFKGYIIQTTEKKAVILGQTHKCLGVR